MYYYSNSVYVIQTANPQDNLTQSRYTATVVHVFINFFLKTHTVFHHIFWKKAWIIRKSLVSSVIHNGIQDTFYSYFFVLCLYNYAIMQLFPTIYSNSCNNYQHKLL